MVAGPTPGAIAVDPATEGAMSIRSQGGGIDGAALIEGRGERFANVVVCVFLKIHDQTSRLNPRAGLSRRMVSGWFSLDRCPQFDRSDARPFKLSRRVSSSRTVALSDMRGRTSCGRCANVSDWR